MAKKNSNKSKFQPKDKLLPKLTVFFFDRPIMTALLWLVLTIFGVVSYTTLLKREGFPSVQIPVTFVSGTYFANDPAKVDSEAAKPLAEIALQQENVSRVETESSDNFFSMAVQYAEDTDPNAAAAALERAVNDSGKLPAGAQVQYDVPYFGATGGDIEQIDLAVSFYSRNDGRSAQEISAKAEEAADWLKGKNLADVRDVFIKNPFETVVNPATGQPVTVQRTFDRYGVREDEQNLFYDSVLIGISAAKGADIIKLDERVRDALSELEADEAFQGYGTAVSASFAPPIEESISELQKVLLEGLLAVLLVGSLVIAIRASLITVISMISVLAISLGFLYAIGYSLNVITLFALILGLALIVDDTIIMVEAIDVARKREKDRRTAVRVATRKISRAMVAATLTASLSFAPLLFVSGILGSFIRAVPVTIIASLLISLLVALIFIPLFSRFILLGKKQMGKAGVKEVAAKFEARLAAFIARPMLWARNSGSKKAVIGVLAILVGLGFVAGGVIVARNVVFNIFPPTKDTNGIIVNMNFPPASSIQQSEEIAVNAENLAKEIVGSNFVQASYYASGTAQTATLRIELTPYGSRDIRSPELVDQLQNKFNAEFRQARVAVGQVDVGPPSSTFVVQLAADNREAALKAASDVAAYMSSVELKRIDGTTARLVNATASSPDQYIRTGSQSVVRVTAGFDADDTSTLVNLAQNAVNDEFDAERLRSYGLSENALSYDLGQESENQKSFNSLVLAFPVLLLTMYILLAFQFRSLLQPLLIFLAIPFSLFGVMIGLDITNNAISFFTLLGFFALIGLSIKNTILLTDYANQARRAGLPAVESAVAALEERFRPLFATSMTAVVALIPLALTSPFWEGLAVVLIFGMLSSTFLVVTVFPYYYLGAEYLRAKFSRTKVLIWLAALVGGSAALGLTGNAELIVLWTLICLLYPLLYVLGRRIFLPQKA